MKICTRCKKLKDHSFFYKYKKRNVYRSNCRECYNAWSREYGKKEDVKKRRNNKYATRDIKNLVSWIGHIPDKSKCEICLKEIIFNGRDINKSIHFDHTREKCDIMIEPKKWLIRNKFNDSNKRIWDSCNFGKLCGRCNRAIPTKNRSIWFNNLSRYIENTI